MGVITKRTSGKNVYYVYQESYRVKISSNDSGKKRGSGKSKVCSKTVYLGSAEKILELFQGNEAPITVQVRNFGLIGAAYQTAIEINLPQIFMKHISGEKCQVPRWIYFFVTIINRMDNATSKNKMSKWLKSTILPDLLHFDHSKMTSKNFWYVSDDLVSEKELIEKREQELISEEQFSGLKDDVFTKIETDLFNSIDKLMGLSPQVICYDTTNFYTYFEAPARSELARTCHSKDSKHHLRHVGLLMAVDKAYGLPLLSRVYRANSHDSKVFSSMLSDLVVALKRLCGPEADLTIVLDKGNNSRGNFQGMIGQVSWVGSLSPSQYDELVDLELSEYHGSWKDVLYYRCLKMVMGIECVVVLTFNAAAKRKKEYSLKRGIEKLKHEIRTKWNSYKTPHKNVTPGIETMRKKSRYGALIKISISDGQIRFEEEKSAIDNLKKRFGKNLIFSNITKAETGYLIDTYAEKNVIENDFQLLKDTTIIRFRPIRHWTDTKIRAYAFCCVVAMTLIRIMQWKAERSGYKMSPKVLKEELADIKEVLMLYSEKRAERKITQKSAVQRKLGTIFNLEEIEQMLSLH